METNNSMARQVPPQHLRLMMLIMKTMTILLMITAKTQAVITCSANTTRSSTTVVCHFGTDINKTKPNFNIQYYAPDSDGNPDTTLMCNFIGSGELHCQIPQGVSFDKVVSETITITGPAAEEKDRGGRYLCQLVPGKETRFCNLTFEDITTTETLPPKHSMESAENDEILTYVKINIALTSIVILCCVVLPVILYITRNSIAAWFRTGHTRERASIEDPEPNSHQDASTSPAPGIRDIEVEQPQPEDPEQKGGAFQRFMSRLRDWVPFLRRTTTPQAEELSSTDHKDDAAEGAEDTPSGDKSAAPLLAPEDEIELQLVESDSEASDDKEDFTDARASQNEPASTSMEASDTPAKNETKKEQAARRRKEKVAAERKKKEAKHQAEEILKQGKKKAKGIINEARGKDGQKEAEEKAERILKDAAAQAEQIKREVETGATDLVTKLGEHI